MDNTRWLWLLLLVGSVTTCKGQDDDPTLFMRLAIDRCTRLKFAVSSRHMDLSGANHALHTCLNTSLSCFKQKNTPENTSDRQSYDIKHKICGYLSWGPVQSQRITAYKWHIKTKETWLVLMKINYFYIPLSDKCVGNRLVMTAYKLTSAIVQKYCGFRLPWSYSFYDHKASIMVVWANIGEMNRHVGFQAVFESLSKEPNTLLKPVQKQISDMEMALFPWKEPSVGSVEGREVYSFVMQTHIQNILHVTVSTIKPSSSTKWFMYDGPSDSYPRLANNNYTSGFILHITVHGYDIGLFFSITSLQHANDSCSFSSSSRLKAKEENAKLVFCRKWFTTENYPKLYVEKFHAISPEAETCRLLGFAVGLDLDGTLVMLRPMCTTFAQRQQLFFVSPNSKLFILFYAYEALSIDIDVRVEDEDNCPGLPVMCQSQASNEPPRKIEIAGVARLNTGTTNTLTLLSSRCVQLFRLPNMKQCMSTSVTHIESSSFTTKFTLQKPTDESYMIIYAPNDWSSELDVFDKTNDAELYGFGVPYEIVLLGYSQSIRHIGSIDSTVSRLDVLDENGEIYATSTWVSPHMWHVKLLPTVCFNLKLMRATRHPTFYFKDKCGNLQIPKMDIRVTFWIEVPSGRHVSWIMDRNNYFCALICLNENYMTLEEKGFRFLFQKHSWNTEWQTISNKAKFEVNIANCVSGYMCRHEFYYKSHRNSAVLEAEPLAAGVCRIDGSLYKVLETQTWEEAKEACEAEVGWEMVSMCDRQESTALLTHALLHPECSKRWWRMFTAELVFIGLQKTGANGQWRWESKEEMKISDWLATSMYSKYFPKVYLTATTMIKMTTPYLTNKFHRDVRVSEALDGHCAGMILFNQHTTPKWIAVPCSERFNAAVICEKRITRSTIAPPAITLEPQPGDSVTSVTSTLKPKMSMDYRFCARPWSQHAGKCWRLRYQSSCARGDEQIVINDDKDIAYISWLLSLWHAHFIVTQKKLVWVGKYVNSSQCVAMQWKEERFQKKNLSCKTRGVQYALCQAEPLNSSSLTCPNGTIACNDNSCIVAHKQCDRVEDCPDGEDEAGCPVQPCSAGAVACPQGDGCIATHLLCDGNNTCGEETYCRTTNCERMQFKCGQRCLDNKYRCNFEYDCSGGKDEQYCSHTQQCQHLKASYVGSNLIYRMPSDLQCYTISRNRSITCRQLGEELSPCGGGEGEHQCFPRYRRCFYDVDIYNNVLFCTNRLHLENCEEFECHGAFKCPGSYCVPYGKLCNSVADCPGGEDELECLNFPSQCSGKIRCSQSNICILLSDWCNGVNDCPYAEDEKLCHECPTGCVCGVYSTSCSLETFTPDSQYFQEKNSLALRNMKLTQNHIDSIFSKNPELVQLDLSENSLTSIVLNEEIIYPLIDLNLADNDIAIINSNEFSSVPYLMHLDLIGNPLQSIADYAFWGLVYMTDLDLSHLVINNIYDDAFSSMYSLRSLNLSNNRIRVLTADTFNGLLKLEILDLSNNPLFLINKDTFKPAEILHLLYTPAFKFCCAASHVGECFPEPSEFSSCSDLMANSVLKVCIWILAFSTFLGNIGVILWRKQQENSSILNFFVQHLGFADMTMGMYLLIVARADFYYRGHYYLYDEHWRQSAFCKVAGFFSMLSSEMSVFVLLIIVTDRITVVGLARSGMGEKVAYAYIVFAWVVAITLSVLPIVGLPYFGSGDYIKNGACFLFNITEGKIAGWEYATAIFIIFNLFALVVLVFGYTFTFISVSLRSGLESSVEHQVARKLALVVFTDCCCWIPPITIGIMSLMDIKVNPQLAVWVAVFAFPLNSTLNPFLYTFSSMRCCADDVPEADDDDYISRVHHIDVDADDDDLAQPSTSTAVVRNDPAKTNLRPKTSLTRRTTPRPRPMRKSTKRRQGGQQRGLGPEQTSPYVLNQPRKALDDIPEVCDVSEEEETNVQISVSVAIKSKAHRRSNSTLDKVSIDEEGSVSAREEEDTADHKSSFLTTATFNASIPNFGGSEAEIELNKL